MCCSRSQDGGAIRSIRLPSLYLHLFRNTTSAQELLRYIKKVLGTQKVVSIAVVAPGSKPGSVGLLEGSSTTPEKLATKTELSQFWRVLAGCVALSGTADGRRIDLLGCRLVEAPREGAALLRELWNLTTVPFAAGVRACVCMFVQAVRSRWGRGLRKASTWLCAGNDPDPDHCRARNL